jgi:hypothetical protein
VATCEATPRGLAQDVATAGRRARGADGAGRLAASFGRLKDPQASVPADVIGNAVKAMRLATGEGNVKSPLHGNDDIGTTRAG